MPVSPGDQLGPYEILSLLGEGGMGQVWKARDTRLDRIVAIKTSLQQFNERFEREARAVAALNHPNVCTLHDIGPDYLVMEYVDGPTLAARMSGGALAIEEALPIARQIAEALEAAHERGIVHRDLKPENVKFTSNGAVKVLDFGLARTIEILQDPGSAPTIKASASLAGLIVGTPSYMSPEQASGSAVDKRTDIWAYGVVLWEMVTGRRMFDGPSAPHILAAVLKDEPVLQAAPEALRPVLSRCLVKDPKKRMRDIYELRLMLDADLSPRQVAAPRNRNTVTPWVVAAAAILIAGIATFASRRDTPAVQRPLMRLEVDFGPGVSSGQLYGPDFSISPDGDRVVFVSRSRLFTRRLDQPRVSELVETEGASAPFFSPDGRWVAFFAGGKLKKISVEGGAALVLCDAPNPRGGVWGEDQTIVAALTGTGVLSRIPDAGGAPQPLTALTQGEATHRWPQFLPGGKAILFTSSGTVGGAFDSATVEVMSLKDRRRKTVYRGATYGRFLLTSHSSRESGHLVYVTRGTLFAAPFDLANLEMIGTPAPVLHDVDYSPNAGFAHFAFSDSGTLMHRTGGGGLVALHWLDGSGKMEALPAKPDMYRQLRISPDGSLVALTVGEGGGAISIYNWRRDVLSRMTHDGRLYWYPTWSPNGRYLIFKGDSGMLWTRADGASQPQPLTQSRMGQFPWSFSPDGRLLAFSQTVGPSSLDLWTVRVDDDQGQLRALQPQLFLQTAASESFPAFSPDGRWIAYSSTETTREIYVRAFPDRGGRWQISNGGGGFAVWSPTGREVFYRTPDQQIMAVNYTVNGDSFVPDKPRLWSNRRLADIGFVQNMDISPDGKRFMVLRSEGEGRTNDHVVFLLNFFDELRRRVP